MTPLLSMTATNALTSADTLSAATATLKNAKDVVGGLRDSNQQFSRLLQKAQNNQQTNQASSETDHNHLELATNANDTPDNTEKTEQPETDKPVSADALVLLSVLGDQVLEIAPPKVALDTVNLEVSKNSTVPNDIAVVSETPSDTPAEVPIEPSFEKPNTHQQFSKEVNPEKTASTEELPNLQVALAASVPLSNQTSTAVVPATPSSETHPTQSQPVAFTSPTASLNTLPVHSDATLNNTKPPSQNNDVADSLTQTTQASSGSQAAVLFDSPAAAMAKPTATTGIVSSDEAKPIVVDSATPITASTSSNGQQPLPVTTQPANNTVELTSNNQVAASTATTPPSTNEAKYQNAASQFSPEIQNANTKSANQPNGPLSELATNEKVAPDINPISTSNTASFTNQNQSQQNFETPSSPMSQTTPASTTDRAVDMKAPQYSQQTDDLAGTGDATLEQAITTSDNSNSTQSLTNSGASISNQAPVNTTNSAADISVKDLFVFKPQLSGSGEIPDQAVEGVSYGLKTGKPELVVQLNPDNLGKIQVSLTTNANNQISAKLIASSGETQEILQKQVNHLKQSLENQGLQVEKITIAVAGKVDTQNSTNSGNSQSQNSPDQSQQQQHSAQQHNQSQQQQQAQIYQQFSQLQQQAQRNLNGIWSQSSNSNPNSASTTENPVISTPNNVANENGAISILA